MSKRAKREQRSAARAPEFVIRTQGLRASGAAGPHNDRRTHRTRTRGDAKRAAIATNTREQ